MKNVEMKMKPINVDINQPGTLRILFEEKIIPVVVTDKKPDYHQAWKEFLSFIVDDARQELEDYCMTENVSWMSPEMVAHLEKTVVELVKDSEWYLDYDKHEFGIDNSLSSYDVLPETILNFIPADKKHSWKHVRQATFTACIIADTKLFLSKEKILFDEY